MANKKVNQLTTKPAVNSADLFLIADPTSGQAFKSTISALGAAIGSAVASVNGLVGTVVLDTDDIQELASPTNRWFTDTRARAALSAGTGISYNSGTGVITNAVTSGQIITGLGYTPASDSEVVKLTGTQTIGGLKTFTNTATFSSIISAGFVKTGGTSGQFLKADGSVDSNTYATTSQVALKADILNPVFTDNIYISGTNPRLYFTDTDSNPDYTIFIDDGNFYITNQTAGAYKLLIQEGGNISAGVGNSMIATSFIKRGGLSTEFLMADGSVSTGASFTYPQAGIVVSTGTGWGTSITDNSSNWNAAYNARITSATAPLNITGTTISISQAGASSNGFLSSTDWNTFNNKASTASLANYLPLAGGTLTGALAGTSASFSSSVTATSFIRTGGSSAAFLKADGSVDTRSFATTDNLNSYLPKTGGLLENTLSSGYVLSVSNLTESAGANGLYVNIANGSTGTPFRVDRGGVSLITVNHLGASLFKSTITANQFIKANGTSSEYLMADGSVSSGPSFTYPGAGIVVSTGSAWGTSITNNSSNWNTAFGWGNHAGLYLPIGGGTLTGALSGTSASFSSSVSANTLITITYADIDTGANRGLRIVNTDSTEGTAYNITSGRTGQNNGDFVIRNTTTGVNNLIFNRTSGAATFSSSVTATQVAIGTTNATAGLEVVTNGSTTNAIRIATNVAFNASPEVAIVSRYRFNSAGDYTIGSIINTAKDNTTDGSQSGNLQFFTNNGTTFVERMRITSSGNVGIGTAAPSTRFVVSNSGAEGIEMQATGSVSTGAFLQTYNRSTGSFFNFDIATNNFFIRTGQSYALALSINSSQNASFAGSVTATGFFESSDKTIKTLIEDNYQAKGIESVTAKLYLKNGVEELGYFAQDVQPILPSAVSKGADGLLNLSYREVHTAKIARLEKRVEELEAQLNLV